MLPSLKAWMAGIVVFMGMVIALLKTSLSKTKAENEHIKQDAKLADAAAKQKERATEALIRGMVNENKPIKRGALGASKRKL